MKNNIVDSFREYIISRINCYKMTKANLPVRAELANACEYLEELIKNNGWISVDDGLPYYHTVCSSDWYEGWSTDKYCPLQIITKDNMLRTAVLLEMKIQDFHGEKLFWLCNIENLNGRFVIREISDDFLEIDEVKYWQPLPQPPKE